MSFNFTPSYENDKDLLNKFGRNLTNLARDGKLDPVIGRDIEIRRIIHLLSRRTKNNPVLIGDSGVGKTAIIEGLSSRIVKGDVPSLLNDKEIYELDLSSVVAGAKFQGEFEERLKEIIKKIKKSDGNIILFIDEIHTIVGAGRTQGALDAANILKPLMARGEIRIIGATTLIEYKKYVEKDPALERRMQKVVIDEPTKKDTINILRGIKEKYELYHGVTIHDNSLISATNLSDRYIQDRFLPDKAIDLVDEACSLIRMQIESPPEELDNLGNELKQYKIEFFSLKKEDTNKAKERVKFLKDKINTLENKVSRLTKKWESEKNLVKQAKNLQKELETNNYNYNSLISEGKYEEAGKLQYEVIPKLKEQLEKSRIKANNVSLIKEVVTEDTIALIVSRWTKIPVKSLLKKEKAKMLNLDSEIRKYVKGQDNAIEQVSNSIRKSRLGINDPNKPIGVFLLLGKTGVGKTELAKTLAKVMFDSEKELVRFDMSEYSEKHSISKLIGSPPGYVGFEEGGKLTEEVRRKPYSILLFDEIEKAHKDVFSLFLQMMDDGHITDSQGRKVNFKNTIIIMTSNIGHSLNKNMSVESTEFLNEMQIFFRPEFINRIDEIIKFNELSINVVSQIIKLNLNKFINRLSEQDYNLNFDESIIKKISNSAYNSRFGARPIKRYISRNIENIVARKILEGELLKGEFYNLFIDGKDNINIKRQELN